METQVPEEALSAGSITVDLTVAGGSYCIAVSFSKTRNFAMQRSPNGSKGNPSDPAGKGKDVAALSRWEQLCQNRKDAPQKPRYRSPLCA